jgi:hypothetical protein
VIADLLALTFEGEEVILAGASGAWLSPVERTVRVREVAGSNPAAPTVEGAAGELLLFIYPEITAQSRRRRHPRPSYRALPPPQDQG